MAAGDVNGDGENEIIVASGPGGPPQVRVYEASGALMTEIEPYAYTFTGGVFVSAGDVDGDGKAEIVTGVDEVGGPQVRIFNQFGEVQGQFFAYDEAFRGGVRVAVGDRDGDGVSEIVTGAGPGGSNMVNVFNASGEMQTAFTAIGSGWVGGVNVGIW